MDNLPPSDNSNSSIPPNGSPPHPPPFGSKFDPHTNPPDPNNPYQHSFNPPPPQNPNPQAPNPSTPPSHPTPDNPPSSIHSEVARHRLRDAKGHFLSYEHPTTNASQTPQASSSQPSPLPPIIEVNKDTQPSNKKYPPLFGIFMTNPVTYLRIFIEKLIKRQAISIKIPILVIIMAFVAVGSFGAGVQWGINWTFAKIFPNYSPILHRGISLDGKIQKSTQGEYFLKSNDRKGTLWNLKSTSVNVKLEDYVDLKVQIKGNLTSTPNLIEVSEIISFDNKAETDSSNIIQSPESSPASKVSPTVSATSNPSNSPDASLPALYPNLSWGTPKNKTLTFTSGTRKIEQDVVYVESSQVSTYPQDFISYYTNQLTNSGFKQTLNSQEPDGIAITYSKANLFLTYGVKYLTSGYKAFIEHN